MNEPYRLPDAADEGDSRPWERPGEERRDRVPHRGGFLLVLALVFLVLSIVNFPLLVPGLAGIAAGAAIWRTAGLDLARMRQGLMDQAEGGWELTADARVVAAVAVLISLTLGALSASCWLLALR